MKIPQFNIKKNDRLYDLTLSISSIICFLAVFLLPKSSFIKTINVIVRYNNSRFLFVIAILLLLSFSIKNIRLSNLAVAVVIFPIFAFALNGLWASMYTETNVIAGILPRKDALSFFTSSMSLIENGYLVGYSTGRRPLFGGFFAALLWFFGKNMLLGMASIAFISAVVTYFALIEVRKTFTPLAAVIFFIPQFLFYRHTIGNVMSEILGYILGVLAISFFLMAYRRKKDSLPHSVISYLSGVFFFTLSQLARPGAIITLPLLVLFAGWLFREENRKYWRIVLFTVLIILFAYALNSYLLDQLTIQGESQFNNAFNGLYGVVVGGEDWNQIRKDYPELSSLEPGIRERRMLEVTLSEFFANPDNFIKGMRYQFSLIFSLEPIYNYNIYSYMLSNNLLVDKILIYSFFIFSLFGIAFAIYKFKDPLYKFILVLLLGFFCSLPVSPAYQSQYMRYYPATIPLLGLLPAVGLTCVLNPLLNRIKLSKYFQPIDGEDLFLIHNSFSILLTCILIIAPLLLTINSSKSDWVSKGCPEGESEVIMSYYPGTEISVIEIVKTWIPYISIGDFKLKIHDIPDTASIDRFESIPLPTAVFPSINILTIQPLYVVMDPHQLDQRKTTFRACGLIENISESSKGDGIFYPRTIEEF
ncbi:MAG: hypothetical protein Q7J07_00860 [Pelolinea sp.]|nr:hypothetical protein [Pelolinea sp.]